MLFLDVKPDRWSAAAIEWAVARGYLQGFPNKTFKPVEAMTREQVAVLLKRVLDDVDARITEADDSFELAGTEAEKCMGTAQNTTSNEQGSGVHIGKGYILTNAHVALCPDGTLAKCYGFRWGMGGGYGEGLVAKYAEGTCVYVNAALDLAILKLGIPDTSMIPVARLGRPEDVRYCQPVLVIGSPYGRYSTATQGIASFVDRREQYLVEPGIVATIPDLIQTDAAINAGNSGGGMFNKRGELIGVPSMKIVKAGVEGMCYAIGLKSVATVLQQAKDQGVMATMATAGSDDKTAEEKVDNLDEVLAIFAAQGIRPEETDSISA